MEQPTDQEIQERFAELPQDVQQAIQSADMTAALQAVGEEHGLHIDQLGALEDEALLVMLGFANPASFADRIAPALKVDAGEAAAIASEVSEELFVPIRDAMRHYMEERLRSGAQPARGSGLQASTPHTTIGSVPSSFDSSRPALQITDAPNGGKTITPLPMQPTIHPADQMLTQPTITNPQVADYAATSPRTLANLSQGKRTVADPYREPVE